MSRETNIFVMYSLFNRLQDQDLTARNCEQLKKAITHYFSTSSFVRQTPENMSRDQSLSSVAPNGSQDPDSVMPNLFVIPVKNKDDSHVNHYESYTSMLWKLRDQVSFSVTPSFLNAVNTFCSCVLGFI